MVSDNEHVRFNSILYIGSPNKIYQEITEIAGLINAGIELALLNKAFSDVENLFRGECPGFRASNTKYHNFQHTCAVTLAVARILHGQHLLGRQVSTRTLELGLLAALFHDTGLIQEEDDQEGTGAKYTIGHEARSNRVLSRYLADNGGSANHIDVCAQMIRCTILNKSPNELTFASAEIKLAGFTLGSADLLAQMAERNYLERLPLLFAEFQEGGVPGFPTMMELFQKTEAFYRSIALKRMKEGFDGVADAVNLHFKERWNVDQDLYMQAIVKQIDYLKPIIEKCHGDSSCLLHSLRRTME